MKHLSAIDVPASCSPFFKPYYIIIWRDIAFSSAEKKTWMGPSLFPRKTPLTLCRCVWPTCMGYIFFVRIIRVRSVWTKLNLSAQCWRNWFRFISHAQSLVWIFFLNCNFERTTACKRFHGWISCVAEKVGCCSMWLIPYCSWFIRGKEPSIIF